MASLERTSSQTEMEFTVDKKEEESRKLIDDQIRLDQIVITLPLGLITFGWRGCKPLPPKYSLDFSDIRHTVCSCFSVKPQEATSVGMCVFQLEQKYVTCNVQEGGER